MFTNLGYAVVGYKSLTVLESHIKKTVEMYKIEKNTN